MAVSFGIEVGDGRLADITRSLLRAHLAMVFQGVVFAGLLLVMTFLLARADERIHNSRHEGLWEPSKVDAIFWEHRNAILGGFSLLISIFLASFPVVMLFLVRRAVRKNCGGLMKKVWRVNHSSTWMVGLTLMATLLAIKHNLSASIQSRQPDCSDIGQEFDCAEYRSAQREFHAVSVGFLTILAGLLICQCVLGALATKWANDVLECMAMGMIFSGSPPVPTAVTGQVAHPTSFCVGKVVQKMDRHIRVNSKPAIEVVGLPVIPAQVQADAEGQPDAAPTQAPASPGWRSILKGLVTRAGSWREVIKRPGSWGGAESGNEVEPV